MPATLGNARASVHRRAARREQRPFQILATLALLCSLLGGAFPALTPVAAATSGPGAAAVTFNVNDANDEPDTLPGDGACATGIGACTLRAAIQEANELALVTPAETFTINLAAGTTYFLTLSGIDEGDTALTGDLDIKANITINGNGATVDGNSAAFQQDEQFENLDRVFHIFSTTGGELNAIPTTVVLQNLTITGGYAIDGNGGGILNDDADFPGRPGGVAVGSLTLQDVNVVGNRAYPSGEGPMGDGLGGGIYNGFDRAITITGGTIRDNNSGGGGGLFNGGEATLNNVTVRGNSANGLLIAGGSGLGGGLFNLGLMTLTGTTVTANGAFAGGGIVNISNSEIPVLPVGDLRAQAVAGLTITGGTISNNTGSFTGGGIINGLLTPGSTMDITGTSIVNNVATGLSILIPVNEGFLLTTGGIGGGIGNSGTATVRGATIANNSATAYGGTELVAGVGGGAANIGTLTIEQSLIRGNSISGPGFGGGIANGILLRLEELMGEFPIPPSDASASFVDTALTVSNSTVSGNSAPYGGGALFNVDESSATLINTTIAENLTGLLNSPLSNTFPESSPPPPPPPPDPSGQAASLVVQNSIVANNAEYNCSGVVSNGGYNIDSGATCAFGTAAGSLSDTDPLLAPLSLNAPGTTQAHALLPGSPALERVPTAGAGCPAIDQRGVARPQGLGCDVGAYEAPIGSFTVTLSVSGPGTVDRPAGTASYPVGSTQTLTATPNGSDVVFVGWTVDGTFVGYANPLVLPVTKDRTVVALFAALPTFCDVTPSTPGAVAIAQLAARGVIFGSDNPDGPGKCFLPGDTLLRIHVAGMVARAFGWNAEDHGNIFIDQGEVDDDLWRNAGTLAFYDVARGYRDGTFDPTGPVLHAQAVSFVTRAMVRLGYWTLQEDNPAYYPGIPDTSGHHQDVVTYQFYAGNIVGTSAPTDPWDGPNGYAGPSSRAYFAQILWQAYSSYFSTNHIP